MTPSVFAGVTGRDEWSLIRELGVEEARRRLEKHWATFITKKDIQAIKKLGLNTVRVPVGYWLFADQDGFLGGSSRYVDQLLEWAEEMGVQVILCLHGAPGSQNGNDHSGRKGKIGWFRGVYTLRKTHQVIQRLCFRYGQHKAVIGIELLNEPHVRTWWERWRLFRYYLRAGRTVERMCHDGVCVVMSDAFQTERLLPKIAGLPLARPVVDTHMYQLFSEEDRALDFDGHQEKTAKWERELRGFAVGASVIVGEWSAAMNELYEPKLKTKARPYTPTQYRAFARRQQQAFEAAGVGWIYWSARTEDGGVWSLLDHPSFINNKP